MLIVTKRIAKSGLGSNRKNTDEQRVSIVHGLQGLAKIGAGMRVELRLAQHLSSWRRLSHNVQRLLQPVNFVK